MFALRKHIIQINAANHGAQGGSRHTLGGQFKVTHLQNRFRRVDDLVIPDEIDLNTSIVFRDGRLVGNFTHLFAQINPNGTVQNRDEQNNPWPFGSVKNAPQSEHDQTLVLRHNPNGIRQEDQQQDDDKAYQAKRRENSTFHFFSFSGNSINAFDN